MRLTEPVLIEYVKKMVNERVAPEVQKALESNSFYATYYNRTRVH